MATIERSGSKTWTGLAVAWGCTVVATIVLGLVAATAPLPHLAAVGTTPSAVGVVIAPEATDRDG
jgi:CDP-diglyceride synthetase